MKPRSTLNQPQFHINGALWPGVRANRPLENTRLSTILHILGALSCLLIALFAYRITRYQAREEGWLGNFFGTKYQYPSNGLAVVQGRDLESRISYLASLLDIQPTVLASAISSVMEAHDLSMTRTALSVSVPSSLSMG